MDPVTGALVGAGVGFLKNTLFDGPAAKRRNLAQAEMTKYSPWTGMKGQLEAAPSAFGAMAQGAMTGAMMGANPAALTGGAGAGAGAGAATGAASGAAGAAGAAAPAMVGAAGIPMAAEAGAAAATPDLLSQANMLPAGMDKVPYSKWQGGNLMAASAPAIPAPTMIAGSAGIPMQAPMPMMASNQQFNPWQGMM